MKRFIAGMFMVALIALAAPQQSFAEEAKDMQGIFEECGLGGLLFPNWPVGASVSNFTWDFGTTATTSGLSSPDSCSGGKAKMAAYIYKSYDSIEQDLAQGDGKYLDMLAMLSETPAEQKDAFVQDLRAKFQQAVARDDYSSMDRLTKAKLLFTLVLDTV